MSDRVIYREGKIPLGQISKQHDEGVKHICAVCGAELIVIFNEEEAKKHGVGQGIFCPNDRKHVNVMVLPQRNNLSF